MAQQPEAEHRAEDRAIVAMGEAIALLEQVDATLKRASDEFHGDLQDLAARMSRHLRFLKEVAELIRHESARQADRPGAAIIAFPARPDAERLLEEYVTQDR